MTPAAWFWSGLAVANAAGWLTVLGGLLLTSRRLPDLPVPPAALPEGNPWPRLSVIVPARNEAPQVHPAMVSLLAQDYPALEVIAVDDRSEDETGALLDALAAEDDRLTVHHVTELPDGWLGKNHACHLGAGQATGDLLLFTDADVHFAPGALRAAVACLHAFDLGHLVVAPHLLAPGYWERAFQATFGLYIVLRFRLWDLRRPRSAAYVGMGAFNLVRRAAYDAAGGHTRLALEVVDDVKLGLLLRRSGARQALVGSSGLVSVRWMPGFRASLAGLLKNTFAGFAFHWPLTLAGALGLLVAGLSSWAVLAAALWQPGAVAGWGLGAAGLGVAMPMVLMGAVARRVAGGNGLEGLVVPVTHVLLAGVVLASGALATWRGGLVWRETFYPLSRLRAGVVRESDVPRDKAVGW